MKRPRVLPVSHGASGGTALRALLFSTFASLLLVSQTPAQGGPLGACRRVSPVDYLERIASGDEFELLSLPGTGQIERTTKYLVPAEDDPTLLAPLFQNVNNCPFHREFLAETFPDRFPGLTDEEYLGLVERRATRRYFAGALHRVRSPAGSIYGFTVFTPLLEDDELPRIEEVERVFTLLEERFEPGVLYYVPDPASVSAIEEAASWGETPFPVHFLRGGGEQRFEAYTTGVSFGRVRILDLTEFEVLNASGRIAREDILVLSRTPSDIEGVVAGVITAEPQLPLSHVAIRTARRGTPNAFVEGAVEEFRALEGELIRLEVERGNVRTAVATLEEAEAWWRDHRPRLARTPAFDADHTPLDDLLEIASADADPEINAIGRYGGKAVNLARLQATLTGPWERYREAGFAIPMRHYLDFLDSNHVRDAGRELTYAEYLRELFGTREFRSDATRRFEALADFREYARERGVVSPDLVRAIAERIEEVFGKRDVMVRFRSSSNLEDDLEFNGAGLYESTSACVRDGFDGDDRGPSACDPLGQPEERTIERALKKVWTSLFTFRAFEERAWYQAPEELAAMGVLVTRAFLDEAANGVAFTGNPANPRDRRYVINVQQGEVSVVTPPRGVTAEKDLLEVDGDGAVARIVRVERSSLAGPGEYVLSDAVLAELGDLLSHVDRTLHLDLMGRERSEVVLDFEFKVERDGTLALKQVRPFLLPSIGQPGPTFAIDIPAETTACGVFADGRAPRDELAVKSQVRFRAGRHLLTTDVEAFEGDLVEALSFGGSGDLALPEGKGRFTSKVSRSAGGGTIYRFRYEQRFRLPSDEVLEVRIFFLEFEAPDGETESEAIVFDEPFLVDRLLMEAEPGGNRDRMVRYSSCDYESLPRWTVRAAFADGTSLELDERFRIALAGSGPANLVGAGVRVGDTERRVDEYWRLVYSAQHHNVLVRYWVLLEPPVHLEGVGDVRAIELAEGRAGECPAAEAAYLGGDFEVLARPRVLFYSKSPADEDTPGSFRRGDADGSGKAELADAVALLSALYLGGPEPACPDAADYNDDGFLEVADAILLLSYLFRGFQGAFPPGPEECGLDPTCDALPPCRSGCRF